MVHPLGDYACQPSDSSFIAHALTSGYYLNGAAYTNGSTQTIANSAAKVRGPKKCILCKFCRLT